MSDALQYLIDLAIAGFPVILITALTFLWALIKGWLVFGTTYKQVFQEMVFWRERALVGTALAEAAEERLR